MCPISGNVPSSESNTRKRNGSGVAIDNGCAKGEAERHPAMRTCAKTVDINNTIVGIINIPKVTYTSFDIGVL